eukprot:COSAG03_NODE_26598_length_258_cov_0.647799_2_plen_49_part_01
MRERLAKQPRSVCRRRSLPPPTRRPFSNVLSLNAVRLTGLGLATVNGLY